MSAEKGLVLDANFLIRAALGNRVRLLLDTYESIDFSTPDVCFEEASRHVSRILKQRGKDVNVGLTMLQEIESLEQPVDVSLYQDLEPLARDRIAARDVNDWPVVAVALLLNVPIWTEDQDFFGTGIATWTTDRVELFLRERR